MKRLVPILVLLFALSCKEKRKVPGDPELVQKLMEQYTAGNQNDGAEYTTVDTLYIISKEPAANNSWQVNYHVKAHYSGPAMGPGYERPERPGLDTDSTELVEINK